MRLYEMRSKQIAWRKSSFCAAGECAEIAEKDDMILMRSTLAPHVVLKYTVDEWRALRLGIQSGEFDDIG
jgi:hypothetical protein